MFRSPAAQCAHPCLTARAAAIACTAASAIVAFGVPRAAEAAGLGIRPGLWDVRLIRQTVDGHDVSAQLTESVAKGRTALAKLPPDARARAEQRFHPNHDSGGNTSFRICLTAAMAASDLPVLDRQDRCRPVMLSQSSGHASFRIQCSADGTRVTGHGQAVNTGALIIAKTDVITRASDGSRHTLHNETQMHFLGTGCGKLLPPAESTPAAAGP
jgi:hypothetical protein